VTTISTPNDKGKTQLIIAFVEIKANSVLYAIHIKKFCNGITLIIARQDKIIEIIKKIAGCSTDDDNTCSFCDDDDDDDDDRVDDVNAIPNNDESL
jgi:hypothetical protein